jgi:hypothetical protein
VAFGFVGLPGLRDRGGTNLMGNLRPVESGKIEDSQLQKLVTSVTKGHLETSKEARRAIARHSSNLLILREIVDRLVLRLLDEGRAWGTFDDVESVVSDLKQELLDSPQAK